MFITGRRSSCSIQFPLFTIQRKAIRSEERRSKGIAFVVLVVVTARLKLQTRRHENATGSRAFAELLSPSTAPPKGLTGITAAVREGHASSDEEGA